MITVHDENFNEALKTGPTPLPTLVGSATALIDMLATNDEKNTFEFGGSTLKLHAVLHAMLHHAEGCGGEDGRRYTASAISLCAAPGLGRDQTLTMLRNLAKTWVTHLLFIFWNDASRSAKQDRADSRLPNPGIRFGFQNLDWAAIRECSAFKDQLLLRDGYRCIATEKADERYPCHVSERHDLMGCHIIRRGNSAYDPHGDPDAYKSAMTTLHLLQNYTGLSEKTIQDMEDSVDDPANGLLLSCESHHGFSRFNWCLQETDVRDQYKVEIYGGAHGLSGMRPGDSKIIEFRDRSAEYQAEPVSEGRREIPVPEPRYLRIHAAIAGVLHMSGAGKFFYEIVREWCKDEEGFSVVQSWEELERVVDVAELEEQLPASLL